MNCRSRVKYLLAILCGLGCSFLTVGAWDHNWGYLATGLLLTAGAISIYLAKDTI
ncbi:MAG: hypothetical protein LKJ47_04980 [Bifidobacteriaceae bacterium]|jgi:hypothetical protein|nr:hypothetical protein [Bifidobacteriaceae bacterium]